MTITTEYALVGEIIRELDARGSWCGETHIQKTAFIAKELLGVPLSASFILYKHGPFSFDLHSTLSSMRADRVISLTPQSGYGPSYSLERSMDAVSAKFKDTVGENAPKIRFVAEKLATKNVAELERIATAVYVSINALERSAEKRASELNRLKPHINLAAAFEAIREADQLIESANIH
jgi:arsenate reductase-like glutaredoxin family protein